MKAGFCYNCGESISRRSLNNVVLHDPAKFRQLMIHINMEKYTDTPGTKTTIHVPVCDKCVGTSTYSSLLDNLKTDKSFKGFFDKYPDAEILEIEEELPPA